MDVPRLRGLSENRIRSNGMKEHGGSSRLVRRLILAAMVAALAMALVATSALAKPGEGNGNPAANSNGNANPPAQGNPAPSQGNRGNGNPGRGNGNPNRGGRDSAQAAPPPSRDESSRGNGAASNGRRGSAPGRSHSQAQPGGAPRNPGQSESKPRRHGKGGSKGSGRGQGQRGNNGAAHQKTTICHATGSETTPYVRITISDRALDAHRRHQHGEDIVPAPAGGCPQGESETVAGLLGPFGGVVDNPEHGKTTICHATGSETNPYVVITISDNALDAHRAHQHGEDIIPAPAEGCPGSDRTAAGGPVQEDGTTPAPGDTRAELVDSEGQSPAGAVLGAGESGPGAQAQLPAADSGNAASNDEDGGSLPFTGLGLIAVVGLGAALLLAGIAGRRGIGRRAA
jgi:hypothetical protein